MYKRDIQEHNRSMENVTYQPLPDGITWDQLTAGINAGTIIHCPGCTGEGAPHKSESIGGILSHPYQHCPVCHCSRRVVVVTQMVEQQTGMGFTINDCLTCGGIFPVDQLDDNSLCATCRPVAPEPDEVYDAYADRMNEAMAMARDQGL